MWPGSPSTSVVNGAAGLIIVVFAILGLYAGRDLLALATSIGRLFRDVGSQHCVTPARLFRGI